MCSNYNTAKEFFEEHHIDFPELNYFEVEKLTKNGKTVEDKDRENIFLNLVLRTASEHGHLEHPIVKEIRSYFTEDVRKKLVAQKAKERKKQKKSMK